MRLRARAEARWWPDVSDDYDGSYATTTARLRGAARPDANANAVAAGAANSAHGGARGGGTADGSAAAAPEQPPRRRSRDDTAPGGDRRTQPKAARAEPS